MINSFDQFLTNHNPRLHRFNRWMLHFNEWSGYRKNERKYTHTLKSKYVLIWYQLTTLYGQYSCIHCISEMQLLLVLYETTKQNRISETTVARQHRSNSRNLWRYWVGHTRFLFSVTLYEPSTLKDHYHEYQDESRWAVIRNETTSYYVRWS